MAPPPRRARFAIEEMVDQLVSHEERLLRRIQAVVRGRLVRMHRLPGVLVDW